RKQDYHAECDNVQKLVRIRDGGEIRQLIDDSIKRRMTSPRQEQGTKRQHPPEPNVTPLRFRIRRVLLSQRLHSRPRRDKDNQRPDVNAAAGMTQENFGW